MAKHKNRKFKTVLVGCGSMSSAWLSSKAAKNNIDMVGFVDLIPAAAEKRAEEFGDAGAIIGTNLKNVIVESGAEILFDVSIPEAHYQNTMTALSLGLHVMGEKPMADTMPRARKMVAAAKKSNRIYAVIQNRRYLKDIQIVKSAIQSGVIGSIHTIQSDFFLGPHFGGFRDAMDHPLLLDMAIHTFDAARYITGADAQSVFCKAFNPEGSWYAHGASANAIFEMNKGISYIYNGSWCAIGQNTSWESTWRVMGTKGAILWDGGDVLNCEVYSSKNKSPSKLKSIKIPKKVNRSKILGHDSNIQEFIDAVRKKTKPMTYCVDNIKSLAMVDGAIKSDKAGRMIPITD
ncbi:MAG: oxidoreductase [Planctomycetota bacterium]|nr:MAG: oxidoreductase [Planctomycetota bacterium]